MVKWRWWYFEIKSITEVKCLKLENYDDICIGFRTAKPFCLTTGLLEDASHLYYTLRNFLVFSYFLQTEYFLIYIFRSLLVTKLWTRQKYTELSQYNLLFIYACIFIRNWIYIYLFLLDILSENPQKSIYANDSFDTLLVFLKNQISKAYVTTLLLQLYQKHYFCYIVML